MSKIQTEYYEAVDKLTDKKNEIEIAEKEADKWCTCYNTFCMFV